MKITDKRGLLKQELGTVEPWTIFESGGDLYFKTDQEVLNAVRILSREKVTVGSALLVTIPEIEIVIHESRDKS